MTTNNDNTVSASAEAFALVMKRLRPLEQMMVLGSDNNSRLNLEEVQERLDDLYDDSFVRYVNGILESDKETAVGESLHVYGSFPRNRLHTSEIKQCTSEPFCLEMYKVFATSYLDQFITIQGKSYFNESGRLVRSEVMRQIGPQPLPKVAFSEDGAASSGKEQEVAETKEESSNAEEEKHNARTRRVGSRLEGLRFPRRITGSRF